MKHPKVNLNTNPYDLDLFISPVPAILSLWIAGILVLGGSELFLSVRDTRLLYFCLICCGLATLNWFLYHWKPRSGQWGTVASLIFVIFLFSSWYPLPGLTTLMVVPVTLCAGFLGISPGVTAAAGASGCIIFLGITHNQIPEMSIALIVVWVVVICLAALYQPIYHLASWAWQHHQTGNQLIEEARQLNQEREQTLEDLAHANQQLTRINRMVQGLRQAAEDARTAKEQFVANVSHELRTPLNMIIGFSEVILKSPKSYGENIPQALLADLSVVYRNAKHLANLVDDVLDLSQLETNQMALTKESVHIQEVIEAAKIAVSPLYASKGLYLNTSIPETLPALFCDRTRIQQVILNLLSNAGRFTQQGGVTLSVWVERDDIVVSVEDTGPGISSEAIDKLFQPFQQADSSIRRNYGGTGLGLNISKRFVELHNGKIWVKSQEGKGSTFFFRLPLSTPELSVANALTTILPDWDFYQKTTTSAPRSMIQPRFYIYEAENALLRLLSRYFPGVEVLKLERLESTLGSINENPGQAIIINDVSIPHALQTIKSAPLPSGMPIFVCSVPDLHDSAELLGVTDYLVKPISSERLLSVIERLNPEIKKILIVDDEPDMLRLFRRILTASGKNYKVLRASSGKQALDLIRREKPDVILLDLTLPDIDGYQILDIKRREVGIQNIPTIVISARDPFGQPVISDAIAITCQGGLSASRMLACLDAITKVLSADLPSAGQVQPAALHG